MPDEAPDQESTSLFDMVLGSVLALCLVAIMFALTVRVVRGLLMI